MSRRPSADLTFNRHKTGDQSPAYRFYRKLLKPDGLIDAKHIEVYFDFDSDPTVLNAKGHPKSGVFNVVVAFIPREHAFNDHGDEFMSYWMAWDTWDNCVGSSSMNWMKNKYETPEAVFAGLCGEYGFTRKEEFYRAVREFARIRQCQWARDMIAAIDG